MVAHIQIGDISPRIQYSGDGVQTVFPYPFPVFADADIQTYVDGTLQSLTSDYTVVGAGISTGGSITYTVPPVAGAVVTLRRNKRIARTSDFQESGEFRAKVINDELDILTALLQQVDEQSARALHLAPTDAVTQTELPDKATRAGMYLGFDATGAPTMIAGPLNTVPVSAFASALLNDVDAAAARVTLGGVIGVDVLSPTGDGSGLTGIATGATPAENARQSNLDFRTTVLETATAHAVVDGWTDVFTDQTGVDTVASLNETYDAVNHLYSNPSTAPTTAYTNPGGTGNRTATITVTTTFTLLGTGPIENQVDGVLAATNRAFSAETVAGKYIQFDFGLGNEKVITEAKWYQSTTATHGIYKWVGSNDAVTWTDIGATFTLGGALIQALTTLSANAALYRYYRLLGVSGSNSFGPWISETEFKLNTVLGAAPNMTLVSNAATALAQPSSVFAVLWHEFVDAVTLGVDLKVWVSRDGGVTWTQVTLALGASLSGNQQILIGTANVSAQPAGTSIKWKIETLNAKAQYVRGVSKQWS